MNEMLKRYHNLVSNAENENEEERVERLRLFEDLKIMHTTNMSEHARKRGFSVEDVIATRYFPCVGCDYSVAVGKTTFDIYCDYCTANRVKFAVKRVHERYVYGLYADKGLVYIGISTNPLTRFKSHVKDKVVDSMTVLAGGSSRSVEAWEKQLIRKHMPVLNNNFYGADARPMRMNNTVSEGV